MNIVWLGDAPAHERLLVGGKAANLSRLAGIHRVPPGFCLTTTAFGAASANGSIVMPPALYDEIAAAYFALAERAGVAEPSVAVRSSAVDEDGSGASFAGQHDTYLNITGAEAIAQAVARCWESAGAARALAYRDQQGLARDAVRLAVLVQQLVAADVAAVLFSANPVTGSRDEVLINAAWGLGESIVGGTVTPDTYVVRKSDLQVIDRQIGDKRRMTVSISGGTQEVDVPRVLRLRPALSDDQAAEMARLALALEAAMGWAVDVECAYAMGHLYLLQCRPITTL
ncbi:MAG: PEP/pyruvate-binding domain-containing protein [Chloroflexi bacterium]|nr:PEP/pyruvate-binding domain-containing protein [Chloroflexota bacterium]MBI3731858.1 PEP/pyruvate-binding domain-containing protein [Chloroflexota bacterium]